MQSRKEKKKKILFTLTAQSFVRDFLNKLSPFFTGNVSKLFFSLLDYSYDEQHPLPHWQSVIIHNVAAKMIFNSTHRIQRLRVRYHDLYFFQKDWIIAHNLLLNYYLIQKKKKIQKDHFFSVTKNIMRLDVSPYDKFFTTDMPSMSEAFSNISIQTLLKRNEPYKPPLLFSIRKPEEKVSLTLAPAESHKKDLQAHVSYSGMLFDSHHQPKIGRADNEDVSLSLGLSLRRNKEKAFAG
jgi:hypothetical protein